MSDDLNDTPQPLMWELHLPSHHEEAARVRCEAKGLSEFVLFENTSEHAYFLSMIAFTAVLDNYIKLVHFDEGLLSIFMTQPFTPEDTALLKRIFDGNTEHPDILLHDILKTGQARFCVREIQEDGTIHQTIFNDLTPYEGSVNYLGLQEALIEQGITPENGAQVVYTVDTISINEWSGTTIDYLPVIVRGGKGDQTIDVVAEAAAHNKDRVKLHGIVDKIDTYIREVARRTKLLQKHANTQKKAIAKAEFKAKKQEKRRGSR